MTTATAALTEGERLTIDAAVAYYRHPTYIGDGVPRGVYDAIGTILASRLAHVEALVEKWNSAPDYAPTEYDRGRVDQRHAMTTELYEALAVAIA